MIYQKEPHPGQMAFAKITQPKSIEERITLAKKMVEELELPVTTLVDTMEDSSRALFSDLPSPVFILDANGVLRCKQTWPSINPIVNSVNRIIRSPYFSTIVNSKVEKKKQLEEKIRAEEAVRKVLLASAQKNGWSVRKSIPSNVGFTGDPVSLSMIISKTPIDLIDYTRSLNLFGRSPFVFIENGKDNQPFFTADRKLTQASSRVIYSIDPQFFEEEHRIVFRFQALYVPNKNSGSEADYKKRDFRFHCKLEG